MMEDARGKRRSLRCLDALQLKLIAMALMLCDHVAFTFLEGKGCFDWMNWIGRLAFPIFAFQIVEGFVHTHSFKRYWWRMFLFALVSEIPFNLMVGGTVFYPGHQNVMFTFCIALPLLALMKKSREKGRVAYLLTTVGCAVLGYLMGYVAMVDYFGGGVLIVLLLYLFHDMRHGWIGQTASMALVNVGLHGMQSYRWFDFVMASCVMAGEQQSSWITHGVFWEFCLPEFGSSFQWTLGMQGFAVLALIPIWMYNGKQGKHSRAIQYACYAFYPVHLLILGLLAKVI